MKHYRKTYRKAVIHKLHMQAQAPLAMHCKIVAKAL
jgi:hypothetical protein